ncbi:MAG: 1-(5-phosphoribosyl)-5-[(5-phosphoribosylamino)methylideneamino]imidazole-4-carboxamide isomerase [Chloroflexota bacterium]
MLMIPAIDIRGGKCVRLLQGDYEQETIYDDNPTAAALRWQKAGARRLHVVDLDGAAANSPQNLPAIASIAASVSIPVQVGGGIRRQEDIAALFAAGVDRAILGTAAVEDRSFVHQAVAKYGRRIVIGIDAREGLVAVRGWRETSAVKAIDLAQEMESLGVARIIYTDISRDGTLTEPNYAGLAEMVAAVRIPVIASGGVSRLEQLQRLVALGVEGVIVGRALYTGHLDLTEALRVAEDAGGDSRAD